MSEPPLTMDYRSRDSDDGEAASGVWGRLPAWESRALPAFPGFFRALGPGIVFMALAQGAGELVFWPFLVAKYGLGFLWLLIPACLLQYPVMYEIGRYTLLTGESVWQGFVRLNRWVAIAMWVLMTVSFMWLGGYVTAGEMDELTNFPKDWSADERKQFWAYAFIGVFMVALLLSGLVYRLIERVMMVIALVTVVGLVLACAQSQVISQLPAFLPGLFVSDWPADKAWDPDDATRLLTAVTFAGLGGFWALFYSYWLREKGVGMAGYMGHVTSPLTGRKQQLLQTGYLPCDTAEDAGRWRTWKRFLLADVSVGILGNLFTTMLCCLLAYALLYPKGLLPTSGSPVHAQAEFFRAAWGPFGKILFLILATAFLSDTWMTTIDAVSRIHTDVLQAYVPRARSWSQNTLYWVFVLVAGGLSLLTLGRAQPLTLIEISAVIGFAGTVAFTTCLLVWNHFVLPKQTPAAFRPRRWSWVGIGLSLVCYVGLAVLYVGTCLS